MAEGARLAAIGESEARRPRPEGSGAQAQGQDRPQVPQLMGAERQQQGQQLLPGEEKAEGGELSLSGLRRAKLSLTSVWEPNGD